MIGLYPAHDRGEVIDYRVDLCVCVCGSENSQPHSIGGVCGSDVDHRESISVSSAVQVHLIPGRIFLILAMNLKHTQPK